MFRPRIIPVLLLKDLGLVKTVKFKNPNYIGDPINAVRIFNDLKADELVILDITATKQGRSIPIELAKKICDEAYMPVGIGGGISTFSDAEIILKNGAEKVIINTAFHKDPELITNISNAFGSQSVTVCIDTKKNFFGNESIRYMRDKIKAKSNIIDFAKSVQDKGAGEIIIQSIERDGTYNGYDLELTKSIAENVDIPVVALGGASKLEDFKEVCISGKAHAAAAGSLFVYHGPRRGILVNYPELEELNNLFNDK